MGYWTLRIEKNEAKNAKNWNVNFSFVFLSKFLCKQALNCAASTKGFRKNLFYKSVLYLPIDHYEQVHPINFEQGVSVITPNTQ